MKVLFLLSRIPYPLIKGDKLRAFHHIREVSKQHKIILVCLTDTQPHEEALEALKPYCEEIHIIPLKRPLIGLNLIKAFMSHLPFQVHYFYHKKAQKSIDKIVETHLPKHIFCQLIRTSEYVRKYQLIPSTLDYMDAFSKGIERRMNKAFPLMKPLFRTEYKRLKQYETDIFKHFNNKTIISAQDRALIEHPRKGEIQILKNGVDLDYFTPSNGSEKKYDLCFVGNMSYQPNITAVQYIAKEILPQIHRTLPHVKLLIAGANPAPSVKLLKSKHITVQGWLPDIREAYCSSKLFLAPMTIGTGLQNKLLEAMSMGMPCVTTPLANKALKATHQKEILIGSTTEELVKHTLSALLDSELYNKLSLNGLQFVQNNYSWSKNSQPLLHLIEKPKIGTAVV
ncbi:MAG: hypothetical protein CL843_14655 [Crocinitomicaceae bacterium]|nr:hypothetical protein [Crocinitomicaceae bacterium]